MHMEMSSLLWLLLLQFFLYFLASREIHCLCSSDCGDSLTVWLSGGNSIYFHQYSMSMQHLRGQNQKRSSAMLASSSNCNNNNYKQQQQQQQGKEREVVAIGQWKWTLWLELFGVFLLKFDAARCRCRCLMSLAAVAAPFLPLFPLPLPHSRHPLQVMWQLYRVAVNFTLPPP